jgi:hypothetical protein
MYAINGRKRTRMTYRKAGDSCGPSTRAITPSPSGLGHSRLLISRIFLLPSYTASLYVCLCIYATCPLVFPDDPAHSVVRRTRPFLRGLILLAQPALICVLRHTTFMPPCAESALSPNPLFVSSKDSKHSALKVEYSPESSTCLVARPSTQDHRNQ